MSLATASFEEAYPVPRAYPDGDVSAGTGLHLAVGMFDGVHIGHQEVIRQAIRAANAVPGDISGVLTFDPHPSRILHPATATNLIMPLEPRIEFMLSLGLDRVFVQPFTAVYARIQAEDFLPRLKTLFPGLRSIHVGSNFRFGAKRSGSVDTIRELAPGCGVEAFITGRREFEGQAVSSSRIREALREGRIREVNSMLGRPYTATGTIESGRQIGRRLGFPTLNIPWCPEALPCFGVYLTCLRDDMGKSLRAGISNYGLRPTVGGEKEPVLEVHLLDEGDFPKPGERVKAFLTEFIRPEQSFPSVEALREQIARDVALARRKSSGSDKPVNPVP